MSSERIHQYSRLKGAWFKRDHSEAKSERCDMTWRNLPSFGLTLLLQTSESLASRELFRLANCMPWRKSCVWLGFCLGSEQNKGISPHLKELPVSPSQAHLLASYWEKQLWPQNKQQARNWLPHLHDTAFQISSLPSHVLDKAWHGFRAEGVLDSIKVRGSCCS